MIYILLVLLLIIISAVYAGGETGIYCINRIRLRQKESKGDRRAVTLDRMMHDRVRLVAIMLGALTVTRYATSAVTTAFFVNLETRHPDFIAVIVLTPVTLVIGEIFPKAIFAAHADFLMYWMTPLIRVTEIILWPLLAPIKAIMRLVSAIFGRDEADPTAMLTTARLNYFLGESRREGTITEQQGRIAQNIMDLKHVRVGRVMTPLAQLDMVPVGITPAEMRRHAWATRFARLPVYDGERSNVGGVMLVIEYLSTEDPNAIPADYTRPAVWLKPDVSIDDALIHLRRAKQRMAIVIDDELRCLGVVTIKDLVEEIVGDLKEW
jgi:putative hemolysin